MNELLERGTTVAENKMVIQAVTVNGIKVNRAVLSNMPSKDFFCREGTKMKPVFLAQKIYGQAMEFVNYDEFMRLFSKGYADEQVKWMENFIKEMTNHEVYEVKSISLCKGNSMPAETIVFVSQYFNTWQRGQSFGAIKFKIVFFREDGGDGCYVHTA